MESCFLAIKKQALVFLLYSKQYFNNNISFFNFHTRPIVSFASCTSAANWALCSNVLNHPKDAVSLQLSWSVIPLL